MAGLRPGRRPAGGAAACVCTSRGGVGGWGEGPSLIISSVQRKKERYLLSFSENPVLEAPGDGGGGVTRSLAGKRDLLVEL